MSQHSSARLAQLSERWSSSSRSCSPNADDLIDDDPIHQLLDTLLPQLNLLHQLLNFPVRRSPRHYSLCHALLNADHKLQPTTQ
jgi:hypothetical protein